MGLFRSRLAYRGRGPRNSTGVVGERLNRLKVAMRDPLRAGSGCGCV